MKSPPAEGVLDDNSRENTAPAPDSPLVTTNGDPPHLFEADLDSTRDIPTEGLQTASTKSIATTNGTSPKKKVSNRKNSKKSTGPKTSAGKRRSSKNAVKHGIFLSTASIIDSGDGMESRSEFEEIHEQLRDYWTPLGSEEELLVEDIALMRWRLRRVLLAETGEIRKLVDNYKLQVSDERQRSFERYKRGLPDSSARWAMERCTLGLRYILDELANVRGDCVGEPGLTKYPAQQLIAIYGNDDPDSLAIRCLRYESDAAEEERSEDSEDQPGKKGHPQISAAYFRKLILSALSEELKRLRGLLRTIETKERLEVEAQMATLGLPSARST